MVGTWPHFRFSTGTTTSSSTSEPDVVEGEGRLYTVGTPRRSYHTWNWNILYEEKKQHNDKKKINWKKRLGD